MELLVSVSMLKAAELAVNAFPKLETVSLKVALSLFSFRLFS